MNRSSRVSAILDLLGERRRLEVEDVIREFGVSPATARRDLDSLAEQQLLTRTRGGAVAHSVAYDLPLRYKNQQNPEAKTAIAAAASALVQRGSTVGICGGTTATAIANALLSRADIMEPSEEPALTIVTNAINIGMQLAVRPQIKTVITGGVMHARSYEVVGSFAEQVLAGITLDIAFIGVNGLDAAFGPTSFDEREATVNAIMAERAERAVIVADASKLGKRAFASVGRPHLFSTVITDATAPGEQRAALRDAGYELIVAGEDEPHA
jgi:DeoR family transcriptional regulator, aga operon transcriptional repressor